MLLQDRSPEADREVATCIAISHVSCPLPLLSSAVASETVLTQGLNLAANLNTSLANQLAFKWVGQELSGWAAAFACAHKG